tara:strand:- start:259 stop:1131 length:873 start_codon:yes stop_codon:yes gene_type:complete
MSKIKIRLRVYLLKKVINSFKFLLRSLNFNSSILISKNEALLYEKGVALDLFHTNKYLKSSLNEINECYFMVKQLEKIGLKSIKNFFDAGAFCGEYTFYIANKYPEANIISLEGSLDNFKKLLNNYKFSNITNNKIKFINKILSNKEGVAKITKGFNAENRVIHNSESKNTFNNKLDYEINETLTIEAICKSNNMINIDYLKIDLEGSEHLLEDDIIKLKPLFIQMEIAPSIIDLSNYLNMLKSLDKYYLFYTSEKGTVNTKRIENISQFYHKCIKNDQPKDIFLKLKSY